MTLAPSTENLYNKNILLINETLKITDYKDYLKAYNIISKIEALDKSPQTKKVYINSIIYLIKEYLEPSEAVINIYQNYVQELRKIINDTMLREEQINESKFVTWEELINMRDDLSIYDSNGHMILFMILSLITNTDLITPKQLVNLFIINKNTDNKVDVIAHNNKYSTFYIKNKTFKAPAQLHKALSIYHTHYLWNKFDIPLFKTNRTEKGLCELLIKLMKKIFNKSTGFKAIQKAKLIHKFLDKSTLPIERRELSKKINPNLLRLYISNEKSSPKTAQGIDNEEEGGNKTEDVSHTAPTP